MLEVVITMLHKYVSNSAFPLYIGGLHRLRVGARMTLYFLRISCSVGIMHLHAISIVYRKSQSGIC